MPLQIAVAKLRCTTTPETPTQLIIMRAIIVPAIAKLQIDILLTVQNVIPLPSCT